MTSETCSNDLRVREESGVTFSVPLAKNKAEELKLYNEKLKLARDLLLCNLMVQSASNKKHPLLCLEATTATGLAALQWKLALRDRVHVTVSGVACGESISTNCEKNDIQLSTIDPQSRKKPGDLPVLQNNREIHHYPQSTSVVLHKEIFDFVFLHQDGTFMGNLDCIMSNIRDNGVVCIISPDLSSLCFRSPHVILRQFQAHVIKTEYVRELSLRVLLAGIARSAARNNRGIEVLHVWCANDTFMISLRVNRGASSAEACVHNCRQVLHCLMCEERVVLPDSNTALESPYNLLSCSCHSHTPGKTAVLLGPMWVGNLFSISHLEKMQTVSSEKFKAGKLCSLLESLLEEAKCSQSASQSNDAIQSSNQDEPTRCGEGEPPLKKHKPESSTDTDSKSPLFYYNLHKKKFVGMVLPKSERLICALRQAGYRASRTHFQQHAVKTSATPKQLFNVVESIISSNLTDSNTKS